MNIIHAIGGALLTYSLIHMVSMVAVANKITMKSLNEIKYSMSIIGGIGVFLLLI